MIRSLSFLVIFLFFCFPQNLWAQDTYLPPDAETYHLLERLETRAGAFSNDLFLSNKGVSRKDVYTFLSYFREANYHSSKTSVDNYNIFKTLSENGEWAKPNGEGAQISKYALGPFYKRRPDLVYVHHKHFFWVLNPVIGLQVTAEQKPQNKTLFRATYGLKTRGRVGKVFGFSLSLTNNNLQPTDYERHHIERWEAIPGAGPFKKTANGYQYLLFTGNLDFSIIKNHISLDIGYGQHFIGDGIRSLFLSNYAGSSFYVGFNTKIWRLNYQNLFLRLQPQDFSGQPKTTGNKYAAIHFLSANIRPWLNIGLFESVTFSRDGGYDIAYMNPIVFYRGVERALGSPDKIALGLNAKAIVAKHLNFYGQFLLNEFTASQFFKQNGYWANKWGLQLGVKYYDAFTVRNLDLQGEINMVRPYTYTHGNGAETRSLANYSTWNQPLAHPLGAGFREAIGVIRYQPANRWTITAKGMLYQQGADTGQSNLGNNIFKDYTYGKNGIFGITMVYGPAATCMMGNINVSYELKPNLYFFAGGTYRHYSVQDNVRPTETDLFYTAGVRLNLARNQRNWY